ncbi:DUF6177 family protein [Amycolatopsis keratiniphila]|uniref:Uncharacterized protein n=1 Tax=Amycolatopsis keratiniphila TaxID=129921 RepID=R4TEC4_9PSEU|nr:DUF6177 family protein [Amycolatopsis keratiniphila]AGM08738.1 hypothetical protein AORI_6155 [Amycolatopsis keratiniphila]
MVEPLTGTPAADIETAEAIVVEQFRSVVAASPRLVAAAGTAAASDRLLQVVTSEHSALTYPLELLLGEGRCEWVVRDSSGGHRDGTRGFPLSWNGSRFAPEPNATAAAPSEPVPGSGSLEVRITSLHSDGATLRFGRAIETVTSALGDGEPAGWGGTEPVTEPWSAAALTKLCRDRLPSPTEVIVTGPGVVGRLRVRKAEAGVLEEVELSGPPAGTVPREAVETLAAEAAGFARMMVVAAHPGRPGGLRVNGPTPPALPYGVLIGHELVARNGVAHAKRTPVAKVAIFGGAGHEAAWCRLDGGQRPPYEQMAAILHHYGMPAQG